MVCLGRTKPTQYYISQDFRGTRAQSQEEREGGGGWEGELVKTSAFYMQYLNVNGLAFSGFPHLSVLSRITYQALRAFLMDAASKVSLFFKSRIAAL